MMLIGFATIFGGFLVCGLAAALVVSLFGFESLITRITFVVLIVPALISFLLGLGLGNHGYHSTLERKIMTLRIMIEVESPLEDSILDLERERKDSGGKGNRLRFPIEVTFLPPTFTSVAEQCWPIDLETRDQYESST